MAQFERYSAERVAAVIAPHLEQQGALLPMLHAVQQVFGCIPRESEPILAEALNLTRAEIHGVVTFYHDFRSTPPGRHVVKLCRAEACQAAGGEALAAYAQAKLGLSFGETSEDQRVTLEPVYCLGLCACAPSAMVDGRVIGRLDRACIDDLIAGTKQ